MVYGPGQAFPPQPPMPEGLGAPGGAVSGVNPTWLAANADRERAVGVLRAGFTEGRLTQEELDDRVAQAYAARTYGQLWALTADLPAGALPYPQFPLGHGALVPQDAAPPSHWKPAAALIITAHTQAVMYPGFQPAHLTPFIQPMNGAHLFPAIPTGGPGS